MKSIVAAIVVFLGVIQPTFSQYHVSEQDASPWGKIDTLTKGDFDDLNPALDRGGIPAYTLGPHPQWLIFERHDDSTSMIIGKRFLGSSAAWDSAEFVISRAQGGTRVGNPDVCSNLGTAGENPYVLAAWEARTDHRTSIFFSYLSDKSTSWSNPILLCDDTLLNGAPHVYSWRDGSGRLFAVVWKHGRALVWSLINPPSFSVPDTIAVSNFEDFEYDILSLERRYTSPGDVLVWTLMSGDSCRSLAATSLQIDSTISVTDADTLIVGRDVRMPRVMDTTPWFFDSEIVFCASDSGIEQSHWVLWNSGTSFLSDEHSLFSGDPNSNINYQKWNRTIIVDQFPRTSTEQTKLDLQSVAVWESISRSDTALVFFADGIVFPSFQRVFLLDTVRTEGFNRRPRFGTCMFEISGSPYNLAVWESNMSGRLHLYSRRFAWNDITHIDHEVRPDAIFELSQNYPNPFNPKTVISYRVSVVSDVRLEIFDILGRKVITLVDSRQSPGEHSVTFDAGRLASGVYFYKLSAGGFVDTKKMIVVK